MHCPKCGNADTKVIDSRLIEEGQAIRRRRQCEYCKARFTTFERKGYTELMVVKRDGSKELYDRHKLKRSIMLAIAKRGVSTDAIDAMINSLESDWSSSGNEISSQRIGDDVVKALKEIDRVAYIRFASVYKKFESLDDFETMLRS